MIINYIKTNRFSTSITKLKKVSYALIITQFLDVLTTFIGVTLMGMRELNPYGFTFQTVLLKILVTILIIYVIEHEKNYRIMWILPIIIGLFSIWNLLNIILEIVL